MSIRRVGLWGGPGLGKSTMTSCIHFELKKAGHEVELIKEVAKDWVYEGREINEYDQLSIFSDQLTREFRVLRSHPDAIIVTECPFLMTVVYAEKYGFQFCQELCRIGRGFELEFPSVNFLLNRGDCPYTQTGRYEDENQAILMDIKIERFISDNDISAIGVEYDDYSEILNALHTIL